MNIAYYTSNTVDDIETIKKYYLEKNEHNNFFVMYEDIISSTNIDDTACIHSYSKHWLKGKIIFTNIKDYIKNKDSIIADSVLLLSKKDAESLTDYEKTVIKNFQEILIRDGNTIEGIQYEQLQ